MLNERQKLLRAPPGIWLVFRQWFCTRWSQTPPAPEQLQLQHNSAWWRDPPVLLHAQVTPELVSLSLQILLSAAGLWWMFCAVNWSLSLFLSPPPSVPSSSPPLTSSLSISFWRWRSRSPVWLLSFWRRRRRPRTTASSPLALPFCLCVSVVPPVKAAMAAGWVCPTVWTPSLFLSFLVFLFLPPPSPRHLWPQAWPLLSPTPNSTLTGMAKGNISFFDTPLDSDRKVGPNCNEVMSFLASSPSQPAWTTTAWEREPKDCLFLFFNDVCF